MRQHDIKELKRLDPQCLENMFNVYKDQSGSYYYNLIKALALPEKLPNSLYKVYTISPGDTWPMISYKHYETPNLWWLILYANKIMDPTKKIIPGDTIKVLIVDVAKEIMLQLRK